ncbi:MAG: hypothetical protein FJY75_11230 [Candidatus Eisenbacteria bacterium]|uniref:Fibronectin type III domain-containing protein n=1 Tax=Eiseniibacteriota bacterium TaxID=2212470 RepID=A0A937XCE7_UNCEI|nr:hypothetical protein [Candidatus Eisenbacteria bacterium]
MNARVRIALLFGALSLLSVAFLALADPNAVITLGTDPEPPDCVANPGGTVTVFWSIQHATTPDHVYYRMVDAVGDIVDEETYPGASGVAITRAWIVPSGAPDGVYWVRLEYWSVQVGLEAVAEVAFLVCSPTHSDSPTWGEVKAIFR